MIKDTCPYIQVVVEIAASPSFSVTLSLYSSLPYFSTHHPLVNTVILLANYIGVFYYNFKEFGFFPFSIIREVMYCNLLLPRVLNLGFYSMSKHILTLVKSHIFIFFYCFVSMHCYAFQFSIISRRRNRRRVWRASEILLEGSICWSATMFMWSQYY